MTIPKVKLISDDGYQQKFELRHPIDKEQLCTIVYGYRSRNPNNGVGQKLDLKDNALLAELWKQRFGSDVRE